MDLEARVAKWKQELAQRSGAGTRGRFSDSMRAEALTILRARAAQGATQEEVGRELGMSSWTLSRWHQRERQEPRSAEVSARLEAPAMFHPVRVRQPGASARGDALVVHGPAGLRVEGLTVEWVAALVRALRS